jgi:hypothetical protein
MKRVILAAAVVILTLPSAFAQPATPKLDEDLRKELQKRVKEDQDARMEYIKWLKDHPQQGIVPKDPPPIFARMEEIDRVNREWLKDVVEKRGWPCNSLVGKAGAHDAWLLVQHADKDRDFQKKCLELIKDAAAKDEVSKTDLAYLTDRVLVAEGKKQLYGTQFKDINGKLEASPIEDEENVDKRRKEVGLPTMAEYRKQIEKMYGPKK